MAHHESNQPVNPDSIQQGYEVGEMGFKIILIFGLVISSMIVISMVAMLFFYDALQAYAPSSSQYVTSPIAQEQEVLPKTVAPVEPAPQVVRLKMETAAKKGLTEYAWISEDGKIAQIPIQEAMNLVAEHGMPKLAPIETIVGTTSPNATDGAAGSGAQPAAAVEGTAPAATQPESAPGAPVPGADSPSATPAPDGGATTAPAGGE